ncbi:MAG: aspartate ammonia-lyase [Deltaproteobacteria bacterium]|nr:aspartate ammonia-lyase [Deltaproteobacteria bacterium]
MLAVASAAVAGPPTRVEHDLLGDKAVPADAYYGVQTARALENFRISGVPLSRYPDLVDGLVVTKLAAARANAAVGALAKAKAAAIERACEAVLNGRHREQFPVDLYQGGAGTSSNMNANEVLANVGLELLGKPKGDYASLDSHDDLNMSQSTNDAYPTALKVAFLRGNDRLVPEVRKLAAAFRLKADEHIATLKMGRTELQDAVPMTVGQELHAMAATLETEAQNLLDAERALYAVNMGGTAIGTGLNAPKGYAAKCARELARLTGKPIVPAADMIAGTASLQGFVTYSAAVRGLAITLSKIASDLILLGSGPRAGLNELSLPALQPGSSIMPGKVNPVMPEVLNVVAFRVMGNDAAVMLAAQHGQLQLNAYEPLVAIAVLESQELLERTMAAFRTQCVDGIRVNEANVARDIERTVGIVTALNPVIGYERASELAAEAYRSGKGILEIVREKRILTEDQIRALLDPAKLTGLDRGAYPKPGKR